MTDYSKTFFKISFTTKHKLSAEAVKQVVYALEIEACENLAEDHWHPEIAGPLQMAIHFLQKRGKEEKHDHTNTPGPTRAHTR